MDIYIPQYMVMRRYQMSVYGFQYSVDRYSADRGNFIAQREKITDKEEVHRQIYGKSHFIYPFR